ncbi:MAG: TIGR04295 family B12-binding domain-containing radical SAM protein [Alphaproteobacteria bacterium]|uniref:TIGR04295 family B12-binding domain-containing radical SAM protein n=1 Tax=Candidatus Nitrobium versatile TaxID=2884831 RepID=A0A953LXU1_9BACT|nr:TIGR04295 family B12-binding domain-containing radical SAM protein [Candidatus Nitrobium versatile]
MKCALINPNWTFRGSVYFGCREPHLPLEYGYAKALLEDGGHEVFLVDGQREALSPGEIRDRVAGFRPDLTVVTTAPSYLFWRCAPPELRVPKETVRALRGVSGTLAAMGPHGSATPSSVLKKLEVDVVIMGEGEEIMPLLAGRKRGEWGEVPSVCYRENGEIRVQGGPHACDLSALPALRWPDTMIRGYHHHHHRFDASPSSPGAEMETSRGCPYRCSFCAKGAFRDRYRKRPLPVVLEEMDGLLVQGVGYLYFIDEIFLPDHSLLLALRERKVKFGIQTRIDLWSPGMLDLLGSAGCVSIEAGVESISERGRALLEKRCSLSTEALLDLLIRARKSVPFVQATLLDAQVDAPEEIEQWRRYLQSFGIWANKPVPVFPYPGSLEYEKRWGAPDERAWERAHAYYLERYRSFSDIQESRLLPLKHLESGVAE